MILKSMASDLGIVTGVNIAEELEYEQESVETRAPFTRQEVQTLLAHLKQAGAECWEWETYLLVLLYTGVRPTDGARLRFADLDLAQGNVRFKPSKTERFTPGEFHIIALHRQLWKQLKSLFSTRPHTATDFICPDLANRQQSSLSKEFRKHCEAAGIDMRRENANHRRGTFTRKTLYSFRHTFNTWLEAAGVSADERRRELGHRNPGSLPSYGHDEDPGVLAARRKLINQLPDFTRGKESLN
jgi:integrase